MCARAIERGPLRVAVALHPQNSITSTEDLPMLGV